MKDYSNTRCHGEYILQIWNDLVNGGLSAIEGLIGTPETELLEFKAKAKATQLELDVKDAQNLGKMLSAFANTAGGVLVWGIITKKENNQDVAKRLQAISAIHEFEQIVRSRCSSITNPALVDIEVRAIEDGSGNGSGYLLIKIPQATQKPVMSVAKDDHRYYLKTADGTHKMPHELVRQAFLSQSSAILELQLKARHAGQSQPDNSTLSITLELEVRLKNNSHVTAEVPYSYIYGWNPKKNYQREVGFNWVNDTDDGSILAAGINDAIVHPGQSLKIGRLWLYARVAFDKPVQHAEKALMFEPQKMNSWIFTLDREFTEPATGRELEFRFGARNCPQDIARIELTKEALINLCNDADVLG